MAFATLGTKSDAEVHMGGTGTSANGPLDFVGGFDRSGTQDGRDASAPGWLRALRDVASRPSGDGFGPPREALWGLRGHRQLTPLETLALVFGAAVLIGLLLAGVLVAAGSFMAAMQRTLEAGSLGL